MVLSMPILGLLAMAMRHTNTVGKGGARIANKILGFTGNDPGSNLDSNQFIATIATNASSQTSKSSVFFVWMEDGGTSRLV